MDSFSLFQIQKENVKLHLPVSLTHHTMKTYGEAVTDLSMQWRKDSFSREYISVPQPLGAAEPAATTFLVTWTPHLSTFLVPQTP
jgi:hypothetical protein